MTIPVNEIQQWKQNLQSSVELQQEAFGWVHFFLDFLISSLS